MDWRRTGHGMADGSWLVRLRWFAVAGLVGTILFVLLVYEIPLRLAPLLTIVGITAATNAALFAWLRWGAKAADEQQEDGHLAVAATMALDLASLTGLLYFSGGPANPFAAFYIVNLALAAVVLPARWAWGLTGAAVLCYGGLFLRHEPIAALTTTVGQQT